MRWVRYSRHVDDNVNQSVTVLEVRVSEFCPSLLFQSLSVSTLRDKIVSAGLHLTEWVRNEDGDIEFTSGVYVTRAVEFRIRWGKTQTDLQ